jgi:cobalt-zinc-cadmium efflux system outer membrane protein
MNKFFYYALYLVPCFSMPGFLNIAHAQDQGKIMLNYAQCDLQQAMDIAMKNNPELTALECELRAAQARISQAGLLPNPTFSAESENFSGDRAGFNLTENTFSITQPFLLGGKIALQKRMADKEKGVILHNFETKKIDVITEVEHAVYDILLFQEIVTFAKENMINAKKLHEFIEEKTKKKNSTSYQHELLSAKLELAQAEFEIYDAENNLEIAKKYLTTLWGEPERLLGKITCELDRTFHVPEYDIVKEYIMKNNHEIQAIEAQREREAIALQLAQAERIPDIDLEFGVRQFAEDDTYSFVTGLSFPLPLFNRNQGKIQEVIDNSRKIEAEKNILINKLLLQLGENYRNYQNTLRQVTIDKNSVLPMAQAYFDLTLREYQEGILEYLEVLNAERKLTETNKRYTEALHDLQIVVATLEKLCAKTFHGENGEAF